MPELDFQRTSKSILNLKWVVHVDINKHSPVYIESHHVDLTLAHKLCVAVFLQRDKFRPEFLVQNFEFQVQAAGAVGL